MRLYFWDIIFTFFFALLVVLSIGILGSQGRIFYGVPNRDLLLMALAIFRLVRLFTYDHITEFIRGWFANAPEGSLRYTFDKLINCPWCTGLWFGWLVVTLYFSSVYSWPVILILALASLGSFFQVLSNLVGWSAEHKKLQARSMGK